MPADCAALVLAAGRGRRFGADKALVEVDGRPLLAWHVDAFRAVPADPIVVVRRPDAQALVDPCIVVVTQPAADAPMFDSLRRGLSYIASRGLPVFVTPVDVPPFGPALLASLLAYAADDTLEVVLPFHDGHRGHPLLLTPTGLATLLDDAAQGRADRLDHWLDAPHRRVMKVDADPDTTLDFDTPGDLARWQRRRT